MYMMCGHMWAHVYGGQRLRGMSLSYSLLYLMSHDLLLNAEFNQSS